jgi:transcriptional antiterminator NusG
MIYTVRTTVGRENAVIETLISKSKSSAMNIKSIFHPEELKGYIFLEGDEESIDQIVKAVPHVKGIIKKEVKMEDIRKFLETKKIEIKVNRGDVIEVTSGPFKNEKGKVTRVDEAKEAAIPIPITVPIESVKVIEAIEKSE